MSPNYVLCIDEDGCKSLDDFSYHLIQEKIKTKKGKTKMHAKLQC
jgi:hypothetical protein